jgi:hypothetical protein
MLIASLALLGLLPLTALAGTADCCPPATTLPNEKRELPVTLAAGHPWTFEVVLAQGWKVNPEAPSRLTVYKKAAQGWDLVDRKNSASLSSGLAKMPPLAPGTDYLLQAVVFYCGTDGAAMCMVQSLEQELAAAGKGTNSVLMFMETTP